MRNFLDLLPRDFAAAAVLARRRDPFMKGRVRLAIDANRRLRHAIEIRHESFLVPSFIQFTRAVRCADLGQEVAGGALIHTVPRAPEYWIYLRADTA
jgi:uncharacterized protein YecE (DUF72 family)